jgi:hypothetical protein
MEVKKGQMLGSKANNKKQTNKKTTTTKKKKKIQKTGHRAPGLCLLVSWPQQIYCLLTIFHLTEG